jgi:hypothetical protein
VRKPATSYSIIHFFVFFRLQRARFHTKPCDFNADAIVERKTVTPNVLTRAPVSAPSSGLFKRPLLDLKIAVTRVPEAMSVDALQPGHSASGCLRFLDVVDDAFEHSLELALQCAFCGR